MKNSQLRTALLWFGLSITGILASAVFSRYITAFDLRGAVTFLGIFMAIGGFAVGVMFGGRAKIAAGMLNGVDVVASFQYKKNDLERIAETVFEERVQKNTIRFVFITIIVIIVAVIVILMLIFDKDYEGVGPILLVFLMLEILMYAASKLSPIGARHRLLKSSGEVIIASSGVMFCGELHIWKTFGSKLLSVKLDQKKNRKTLCFRYSYYVSYFPPIKNEFDVCIPFFDMESDGITEKVLGYFKL